MRASADAFRDGIVDVLSMRSLIHACRIFLGYRQQGEFDRALVGMINMVGAAALERERLAKSGCNSDAA